MSTPPNLDSTQQLALAKKWFPLRSELRQPRARLFCFPYAGGGASVFRTWSSALEPHAEVCAVEYPGRWSRHREPCSTDLKALASAITDGLTILLDQPFSFFGYSLGTVLAFEVARELRRRGLPSPQQLMVGARQAPQERSKMAPIHALANASFMDEIDRRYGLLPAAIRKDPDLLKMVLPVLRADITALETYVYTDEAPLSLPITAFGGATDKIPDASDLASWQTQTTAGFSSQLLPGGHFFLSESAAQLLPLIREKLTANGVPQVA